MTGDYEDVWSIMKQRNCKEWTERVAYQHISQIVKLDEDNKLIEGDVNSLKDIYANI